MDAATGAYYYYPDVVKIPMEPLGGASETEKGRYRQAVMEREKWLKEEEEKLQREIKAAGNQ